MATFPSSPGKLKNARRCGLLGNSGCLLAVGLCTLVGGIWLAWRFDSLWHESGELPVDWDSSAQSYPVNITVVQSAVASGAVCLDGSPPPTFWDRGTGQGVNNWIVFLEGGGWCASDDACLERSFTGLGSSKYMPRKIRMEGVLSSSPVINPDFHNWNRVLIKYCDGGSFNGDVGEPKLLTIKPNSRHFQEGSTATIFYRGQRIWNAVMKDLLDNGMKKAQKALLLGCSAGGLASILHCDQYQALVPSQAIVKCGSDAGFFIDIKHDPPVYIADQMSVACEGLRAFYEQVVLLQNMVGNLPKSCTSQREESQCIFPQHLIGDIMTPFFILNPAYDTWQFDNVLLPSLADPEGIWDNCKRNLADCSETELKVVQGFRDDLLKALEPVLEHEKDGVFIDSCYVHCQSHSDNTWNGNASPKIGSKSPADVIGDWFYSGNSSKFIDCPFPCNLSC